MFGLRRLAIAFSQCQGLSPPLALSAFEFRFEAFGVKVGLGFWAFGLGFRVCGFRVQGRLMYQ